MFIGADTIKPFDVDLQWIITVRPWYWSLVNNQQATYDVSHVMLEHLARPGGPEHASWKWNGTGPSLLPSPILPWRRFFLGGLAVVPSREKMGSQKRR